MIANRVEQQIIRRTHPLWGVIDEMCFNAKNLYNYANYIIRQEQRALILQTSSLKALQTSLSKQMMVK